MRLGWGAGGPHLCLTCLSSGKSHSLPLPFAMHTPENGLGFIEIEVLFQSQGRMLAALFMPWSQYRSHLSDGHCHLKTPVSLTRHPFASPFCPQGSQRPCQIWLILPFSLNLSLFSLYAHIDTHRHIDTHTEFKPPLKITSPPEQVLLFSVHLLLPLFLVTVPVAAFSEILPVFMTK